MLIKDIIDKLYILNDATHEELEFLIDNINDEEKNYLFQKSHETRMKTYGNVVYMRGLIEFTNYCKRDCLYCGIRRSNNNAIRYRLTVDEIMESVHLGDMLGYKTFVLQGGEDSYYTDELMTMIISKIKRYYPNNAITLSLGERSYESYKKLFDAGADRYLLRHETINNDAYKTLHPDGTLENRINCLKQLKEIGYEVGAGFMVGLPNEKTSHLVENLLFVKMFNPQMCGIGPFIPHKDTQLKDEAGGTLEKTILMLALTRLLLPNVLLPATTALGSIDNLGREKGIQVGANVVMPNLSPTNVREKYSLYDGKICTGDEAAECRVCIEGRINRAGFKVEIGRGNSCGWISSNESKVEEKIKQNIITENLTIRRL